MSIEPLAILAIAILVLYPTVAVYTLMTDRVLALNLAGALLSLTLLVTMIAMGPPEGLPVLQTIGALVAPLVVALVHLFCVNRILRQRRQN
jgi:hypothetical protein